MRMASSAETPIGLTTARGASSWWVITALTLVGLLAAVDRNVLALLLDPIKKSLGASDTAMGALTGAAFAPILAFVALPIAHFADRSNRRNLLVAAVAFWSLMTGVGGLATSFAFLLTARVGVALGESGFYPTTMSLIGDYFPSERRGGVIGILTIGSAVGFAAGALLTGLLNDRYGWHTAMMVVGAPGLVLALAMFLTLKEPPRRATDAGAPPFVASLLTGLKTILRIPTVGPLMAGMVLLNLAFLIWLNWLPAFLMRAHHLSATKMGAFVGLAIIGGAAPNLFAGFISDALARRGERWRMYLCCLMVVVSVPLLLAALLLHGLTPAIVAMCVYSLAAGGLTSVTGAALLSIAPPSMRALTSAISLLAIGVIAAGGGPLLVGMLNDALKADLGQEAIRYSMLVAPAALSLAGVCFLIASRTIEVDCAKTLRP
jgi:MFS family permease